MRALVNKKRHHKNINPVICYDLIDTQNHLVLFKGKSSYKEHTKI